MEMWRESKAPEAPGRIENLKEMLVALGEFENLGGFLEHVSLVMENEDSATEQKVTLMTLHGAKGLEFETVFLPGWEEGLFPHQRALDEGGASALEEERRLAYVGITRAGRRAQILFAANRRIYGKWQSAYPSRFIDELPPEHVNVETTQGLYGSERHGRGGGFDDFGHGISTSPRNARRISAAHRGFDGDSWKTDERGSPASAFDIGERIFHQKFGYGRITSIDGNKLEISFEKAGVKKVVDSFVEPT
jgi:DNA helicase-2/ATP-dependent DNA helicase PcrA